MNLIQTEMLNDLYLTEVGCITVINQFKLFKPVIRIRNGVQVQDRKEYVLIKCKNCGSEHYVEQYTIKQKGTRPVLFKRCKNCTKDLYAGYKVGRLTLMYPLTKMVGIVNPTTTYFWHCKCECGNELDVRKAVLRKGDIKSCGKCNDVNYYSNSPLYKRAYHILERCNNPNSKSYIRYGARGIKCLLGNTIPEVIQALEKVPGFEPHLQIDRIDNDGHYTIEHPIHGTNIWIDEYGNQCLGNLRWVTSSINVLNQSEKLVWSTNLVIDLAYNWYTEEELKEIFEHRFIQRDLYKFIFIEDISNNEEIIYKLVLFPLYHEEFSRFINEQYIMDSCELIGSCCLDEEYELSKTLEIVQRLFVAEVRAQ